jgi:hypothetical protein
MSQLWDAEADTYDDEPDQVLADPQTRAAWRDLLLPESVYWGKDIADERYLVVSRS